ncbi:hypothetical protein NHQ30_011340 [Ciborinia camelliae]|nr:hypothetical protein NHQ30_011340 [Ciborinia camelliae]
MVHNTICEQERIFSATRVVRPQRSIINSPKVVRCVWTSIETRNLTPISATAEQMNASKGCWMHRGCKGHLTMDPDTGTYMIPYGYAAGDELVQSDGFMMNKAVLGGDKNALDVADFCFRRLKGKRGILRKACNGCRPTNSMRFLITPPPHPHADGGIQIESLEMGTIILPEEVFVKGRFVHMTKDGKCNIRTLREGEIVAFGRCPSQGPDSALPMMIKMSRTGEKLCRVPLEVCPLTNADFDGDECWIIASASDDGQEELVKE